MASFERIYFDHNATSPLRPEARDAMLDAFSRVGNASSVHSEGRWARGALDTARESIAALCGADPRDVVFTSGGTEALALALTPRLMTEGNSQPFGALLVGATEHACVLEGHRFPTSDVRILPVDGDGLIDAVALAKTLDAVRQSGLRPLVAIQLANNETGVIQPIAALSQQVHEAGGILVCDAVQGAGKVPLDQYAAGADILTLSAHKLGGPQGVGALVLKSGGITIADRLLRGGGQERGARAGTENIAGIAGFGAAAQAALASLRTEMDRLAALRGRLDAQLEAAGHDVHIFAKSAKRLPNTLAFSVPGLTAETGLMTFDLRGVALSSGSACSSGKVRSSHVLAAMGVPAALAKGALRVSLGWTTTEAEVIRFGSIFETVLNEIKTRTRAA